MANLSIKPQTIMLTQDFLQKDGLKCVIIEFNEVLERGKRLDASFFDIEGKKARQAIANCHYKKLPLFAEKGFAANVYHFPPFKRIFVKKGIPIFTASQILDSNPLPEKFISGKTKADLDGLTLRNGQIVITCSGSIGFCSIVTKTLENKLMSHDLIRIECNNPNEIGYIYAFLKTKIGHKVITTSNYGSVVTHIEPEHLQKVIVPRLSDKETSEIHTNVMTAFKLRDEANQLIGRASDIMTDKLKMIPLSSLNPKYLTQNYDERMFSKKASDLKGRLDVSFHLPIVDEINKQLKKSGLEITTLGDKRVTEKIFLPGRFKRIYVSEDYGVPFLSGGDIQQFDPKQLKYLSISKHNKRVYEELSLHENMILVTRSGTVGKVVLCPKYFEGWSATEHILRIMPSDETNIGYIYAFLSSDYGRELIRRYTYGSVVDEIDDNQLSMVEIPLPPKKVQDEIGNLVLEANKKRAEAYKLEKVSVDRVQELIVGG